MKSFIQSRAARVTLLFLLCSATFLRVKTQRQVQQNSDHAQNVRQIPHWDSHGKVIGNPQNIVDDFRKIHVAMRSFRNKFRRYPESLLELLNEVQSNFRSYGFRSKAEALAAFENPDMARSHHASFVSDPMKVIPFEMRPKRPNGQALGEPKGANQRDVLAWTDLYYHPNVKTNLKNQEASTMNPVGFYIVLWDDGQIEKVPFDKTLAAPLREGGWQVAFRGQAGLPARTATFDQMNRPSIEYRNWKRAKAAKAKAAPTRRSP